MKTRWREWTVDLEAGLTLVTLHLMAGMVVAHPIFHRVEADPRELQAGTAGSEGSRDAG